jgi:hypothetical protein
MVGGGEPAAGDEWDAYGTQVIGRDIEVMRVHLSVGGFGAAFDAEEGVVDGAGPGKAR